MTAQNEANRPGRPPETVQTNTHNATNFKLKEFPTMLPHTTDTNPAKHANLTAALAVHMWDWASSTVNDAIADGEPDVVRAVENVRNGARVVLFPEPPRRPVPLDAAVTAVLACCADLADRALASARDVPPAQRTEAQARRIGTMTDVYYEAARQVTEAADRLTGRDDIEAAYLRDGEAGTRTDRMVRVALPDGAVSAVTGDTIVFTAGDGLPVLSATCDGSTVSLRVGTDALVSPDVAVTFTAAQVRHIVSLLVAAVPAGTSTGAAGAEGGEER